MNYKVIELKSAAHPDSKYGCLAFFEGEKDIPFAIKRIFFIYKVESGKHRGFHAHKSDYQLLFCPYGKINVIVDDGSEKTVVALDKPTKGLVLAPEIWREMIWEETDSVLCVADSENYDPNEYIRDYDEFLEYIKNLKSEPMY